jgi:hypothetical protein
VVPVLVSAAGRTPGVPTGTAIAAVASAGYPGLLAGPPVIGLAAQATMLTAGLGLVALCLAQVALGAATAER